MVVVIDTCGWAKWLTDDLLVDRHEPYLREIQEVIMPRSALSWIQREDHLLPSLLRLC